jgi:hypothetical protein
LSSRGRFGDVLVRCGEWADGTRSIGDDAAESALTEEVGKQPELWWQAVIALAKEAGDSDAIQNLAIGPLAALAMLNPDWIRRTGEVVGRDERLATLLVDCLDFVSESWAEESRQILGDDFLMEAYLAINEVDAEEGLVHNWASQVMASLVQKGGAAEAWAITLAVIERANEDQLGWVGASVVEDLVKVHGAELIELLEAEFASNLKLRRALSHAYLWTLPRALFDRIELAAGVPLYRPKIPKYPGKLPLG